MQFFLNLRGILHGSVGISNGDSEFIHRLRGFFWRRDKPCKSCLQAICRLLCLDSGISHNAHI